MARRHSGLRGLASLGNAAGGKAVHNITISVSRYRTAFRNAQMFAGSDPVKAFGAVAAAKKALVDAEASIAAARAARVMVPPDYIAAFKAAAATIGDLNELAHQAGLLANEMTQVDPEWSNARYGSAMPDPAYSDDYGDNARMDGLSGRGKRRCCKRKTRR